VLIAARHFIKEAWKTADAKRIVKGFIEELWDHRRGEITKESLMPICTVHVVSWLFGGDSRHGSTLSFRDAFLRAFPDQVTTVHRVTAKREGCANAFMQLAGTRAADRRAGRADALWLADPRRQRSARWADLTVEARAPGAGGAGCSA
jgi:predicted thioredoxin/glutaredoxin